MSDNARIFISPIPDADWYPLLENCDRVNEIVRCDPEDSPNGSTHEIDFCIKYSNPKRIIQCEEWPPVAFVLMVCLRNSFKVWYGKEDDNPKKFEEVTRKDYIEQCDRYFMRV